jgi:acetylornithine deacetylase/succinyl-diaminopimelate desuccinylase-like protein
MVISRNHACAVLLAGCLWISAVDAWAQDSSAVPALARDANVAAAIQAAKADEHNTIEQQIRICEVPAPPFNETARGALLKELFTAVGLRNVRTDRVGNVLGERPGLAVHPHLVIAAHLDTVFPEGTPVAVTRRGTVLSGPGIGDNCRGLAVILAVVRALDKGGVKTTGPITFVANVGEEGLGDLRGMKELFGETLEGTVDRFVSIDNAGLGISTIGVGSKRYRVTFNGPGGHSFGQFGLPNPANALGRAIAKISEFQVPREPRTTFNVGRVGGGTSVNAIPADAWMEVDLRSSDPAQLAILDRKLQQAIDAAVLEENARWSRRNVVTATKTLVGDRPAGVLSSSAPIVTTAQAVAHALGLEAPLAESSSDSNLPLSLNIPAITIGGGGGSSDSHAVSETFTTVDSWEGTANAVLLAVALSR